MANRLLIALALSSLASAQEQNPRALTPSSNSPAASAKAASGPGSAQWRSLSVADKLRYDGRHFFDIENLIFAGVGAAFDYGRDRPGEWGDGASSFAERYASHLGYYLVQRSIMFPVQAIDHEDPRYFRSTSSGYKRRLRDALLHSIWRRNDSGGMMPAYSEFLGDYGAAAVSRMWWPAHYHTGSSIFYAGSSTLAVDAGINIFHEFQPDLKRWLRFKRLEHVH
jgi:hypothetical protein